MPDDAGFPPVPSQVFSVIGPLPVNYELFSDEDKRGEMDLHNRSVSLRSMMPDGITWQTYWHEAIHVALQDAGVANQLSSKLEETLCDALGTYFAAAVRAGFLKVNSP